MRRSRINWAATVIAPWCLGMGLLVSITADAGQNATIGGSLVELTAQAAPQPGDLVPMQTLALTGDLASFGLSGSDRRLLTPVRLDPGSPDDFKQFSDEIEPRRDLKRSQTKAAHAMPLIDRTNKGDPGIGLRPTFDTRMRRPGGIASLRASEMIGPHDDAMPAGSFSLQDDGAPLDGATAFAPWGDGEDPQAAVDATPILGGMTIPMRPAAFKERLSQGATPKISRAEALASTTPIQADATPIEASLSPQQLQIPNASVVPRAAGRPDYASLLSGEHGVRERKCLAEAVYFESRSEPEDGQAAVAQVVLNRATSGLYPASICGVVYQNRTHYKACQFSFACEGKSLRINEPEAWKTATRIADEVLQGKTYLSDVGGATHYHAKYVRPGWARRLVKMDVIGHHVFYKLHTGQT
jgi:spore germination cell wall hydrolase CwlJ-like protein